MAYSSLCLKRTAKKPQRMSIQEIDMHVSDTLSNFNIGYDDSELLRNTLYFQHGHPYKGPIKQGYRKLYEGE